MPPLTGYFTANFTELRAIPAASRANNYARLIAGPGVPPSWYAWYVYHGSYNGLDDDEYFIVPDDGIGAWVRENVVVTQIQGDTMAPWQIKEEDYTAIGGDRLVIISGAVANITITLPPVPPAGTEVRFIYVHRAVGGRATIGLNGANYQGTGGSELFIDQNSIYEEVSLIYINSFEGWIPNTASVITVVPAPQ